MAKPSLCNAPSCDKAAIRAGFCSSHYRRNLRHGDPLGGRGYRGEARRWVSEFLLKQGTDDCIFWPFTRLSSGYGILYLANTQTVASRYVCSLVNGPPPETWYQAAHSCGRGTDACVNPKHLRWATPSENHADKRGHGTHRVGGAHPGSKLTDEQIAHIQAMVGKCTQRSLADKFGVSHAVICRHQKPILQAAYAARSTHGH